MKKGKILCGLMALLAFGFGNQSYGQNESYLNVITTAVPFLMISPDTRSGGMGDVGAAISPDANSVHWNMSKLAFTEHDFEVSVSYSPWLRELVEDINLAYLSGYKRIDKRLVVGGSLRYFSLGEITFTDAVGNVLNTFSPNEFSIDGGAAFQLSKNFSAGMSFRYIYSNLTGGNLVQGIESKPGQSVSTDINFTYINNKLKLGGKKAIFSSGINVSNIGAKMSYTETSQKDFIPTNLRLGSALTTELDDHNSLTFGLDFNKLLVPTTPLYQIDPLTSQYIVDPTTGEYVIEHGRDPNRGVASGIFGSFSDAPGTPEKDENGDWVFDAEGKRVVEKGSKFKEELKEINIGLGLEYWYQKKFALRMGYFTEAATKGNRKYFTLGAGLRYSKFGLDLAYLVSTTQRSPLANTVRFTLGFAFDKGDSMAPEGNM